MKKWIVIAVLVAIAAPVLGARQTVVRTDSFGTGWTKQNNMNTELYQKTDPTETGFTGMDGAVITSGVVPSAKNLSPDKVSGVPSINFLYEANGTDTNGFGFLGPLNSSKNILYRISDESPAYGNVLTVDSVVVDQTITVGGGSMVADVVTLILADESGASGFTSFPAYKDSPGTKGQYAVNDTGTLLAMCVDTNSWRTVALSDTLSLAPTTPTLTSLTIPTSGDTATAVFSEAVSYGAGGAGGWTLNSPTNAMTYASGTGTDTIVFNLSSTILSTDTPTVSYTQPTNGFESADDGVDLASITNASVTNSSTQTGDVALFSDDFNRSDSGTIGGSWDTETDSTNKLAISSNRLVYAGSNADDSYLREGTHSNLNESTIKFKIGFSNVTGVSTGVQSNFILKIFNDSGTLAGYVVLNTNSSGNIQSYQANVQNNTGSVSGNTVVISDMATLTMHDAYLYHVAGAGSGGVAFKIGEYAESTVAFTQTNDTKPMGGFWIGAVENYWSASTPYDMFIDDVELYEGDNR